MTRSTKAVLIYSSISGALSIVATVGTAHYLNSENTRRGDILGYTWIVVAALLVFFGIRAYRENTAGRSLSFGRGLTVGIFITLVATLAHIVTFEILYFVVTPDLGDRYAACMVRRAEESGGNREKIEEAARQAQMFKKLYDHPATNAAVSFAEMFPVGLVTSAVAAAILRRRDSAKKTKGEE